VLHRHCLIVTVVAAVSCIARGNTIFVDDDAPPGGDGLSWNTAFRFLQDALADAGSSGGASTEIRIGQGRYQPDRTETDPGGTGSPEVAFRLIDGVALRGGYAVTCPPATGPRSE